VAPYSFTVLLAQLQRNRIHPAFTLTSDSAFLPSRQVKKKELDFFKKKWSFILIINKKVYKFAKRRSLISGKTCKNICACQLG